MRQDDTLQGNSGGAYFFVSGGFMDKQDYILAYFTFYCPWLDALHLYQLAGYSACKSRPWLNNGMEVSQHSGQA